MNQPVGSQSTPQTGPLSLWQGAGGAFLGSVPTFALAFALLCYGTDQRYARQGPELVLHHLAALTSVFVGIAWLALLGLGVSRFFDRPES